MSITYSESGKVLIKCSYDEESVIVPEGVTQIKKCAFLNCIKLKEVVLPESIRTIGSSAFESCISLKKIVIPSGVKKICRHTFDKCKLLEEVILPEGLEKISDCALSHCESLERITFPDSLKSADSYIFSGCKNLKEIRFRNINIHINIDTELIYFERVINFIRYRPLLRENIDASVKYDILWQMLFQHPEDKKLKDYLRQYFSKIFLNLLDRDDSVSVQKVLDDYDFITKNNIDKFIRYSIDNQKLQCQLLLMNYKSSQNWQKQKNLFL